METGDIISILFAIFGVAYILVTTLSELNREKKRGKQQRREQGEEESVTQALPAPKLPRQRPPSLSKEQKQTGLRSMRGVDKKFEFRSNLEEFHQKTNIDERALQIHLRPSDELVSEDLRIQRSEGTVYNTKKKSRIQAEIASLPSRSILIISHELIRGPVAFRSTIFPRDV